MTYSITCEDTGHNDALADGYVLEKSKSVSCVMKVKFKDVDNLSKSKSSKVQASVVNGVYTQGAINATIRADWLWVQKSGSNSGGNEQGGNTPSNEYETTFDGNYRYTYSFDNIAETSGLNCSYLNNDGSEYWCNVLEPNQKTYVRSDSSNNKTEVCGVFSNGTVCMEEKDNLYDDFDYIKADLLEKAAIESGGVYSCEDDGYNYDYSSGKCTRCPEGYDNYDYESGKCENYDEFEVFGYVAAKKQEMEAKGATCTIDNYNIELNCTQGDLVCEISSNGYVHCETGTYDCTSSYCF